MPSEHNSKQPHSSALRRHRCNDQPGTFFITKSTIPKRPVLIEVGAADTIIDSLRFLVEHKRILLAAFVVMPDHWHALFYTIPPQNLLSITHQMGSWIGRKTSSDLHQHHTSWQESVYDTRIRSSKQLENQIRYIERNPVERGLVQRKEEWQWSSSNVAYSSLLTRPWPLDFIYDYDEE